MRTITVAELRQNPTAALRAVERGETYALTRHRRVIGHLVPAPLAHHLTAEEFTAILEETPVDPAWAGQQSSLRADFDTEADPWEPGG